MQGVLPRQARPGCEAVKCERAFVAGLTLWHVLDWSFDPLSRRCSPQQIWS